MADFGFLGLGHPRYKLEAVIQVAGYPFTYESIPEALRDRMEISMRLNDPQAAIRLLEQYAHSLKAGERRQTAAARLKRARRAHGVRKVAPRWQRGARRPRSIEAAMQDPRVRGQIA